MYVNGVQMPVYFNFRRRLHVLRRGLCCGLWHLLCFWLRLWLRRHPFKGGMGAAGCLAPVLQRTNECKM